MANVYAGVEKKSEHVVDLMQRVNALELVAAGGGATFAMKFGSAGTGAGQFVNATGVAVDSSGNIYVADRSRDVVQKFDSTGAYVSQFGSSGSGNGQFNSPYGIAFDSSGNIYVTDLGNSRVQKFDSTGVYVSQFGNTGPTGERVSNPIGIAIDSSGNIYVVSRGSNSVTKYSTAGAYITKTAGIGGGSTDGQFQDPNFVTIDSSGNVYVTDGINDRVQIFDSSLGFIDKFSGIDSPWGVAAIGSSLYVAEGSGDRVIRFTLEGVFEADFGSTGTGDGQFSGPLGLAVHGSSLFVVDGLNDRVQKFTLSDPPRTSWTAYRATESRSLGVSPGLNSLAEGFTPDATGQTGAHPCPNHITDVRDAIEALVATGAFINPATSNPFNFTPSSPDNLYYNAMGDRTAYGATGGAAYTWTRNTAAMVADITRDIDIGELHECVSLLESL